MSSRCEECNSDNYCNHCSSCHDCIQKRVDINSENIDSLQNEIIEYKAFMLGLELSSEDEARLLDLLAKYKKGE